jgi:hypothetical protein
MQFQRQHVQKSMFTVRDLGPGTRAPCRLPISDATYYANAHVLLHDDHTFRFAYKRDDTASIQMMDPDKTEVSPGAAQLTGPQSRVMRLPVATLPLVRCQSTYVLAHGAVDRTLIQDPTLHCNLLLIPAALECTSDNGRKL